MSDDELAWAMLDACPDALVLLDERGSIELLNRQTEVMLGFAPQELVGRGVESLLSERSMPAVEAERTRLPSTPGDPGGGSRLELVARRKDGTELPVEVTLRPVASAGGRRTLVTAREVTTRPLTEPGRPQSSADDGERRLIQHCIDAVSDAVFVCDEHTLEFLYVNRGASDLHGYSRDELLAGLTPADLAPTMDPAEVGAVLGELADAPAQTGRITTLARTKAGTEIPVDVRINWPLPAEPGGRRPVVAVVRDVSERARAERELAQRETWFRATFHDGPVPMAVVNLGSEIDREIVDVNQAWADLIGLESEALIGRSAPELFHPDDRALEDSIGPALTSGQADRSVRRLRLVRADGSVAWVQVHAGRLSPHHDPDILITHVVDVTADVESSRVRSRQEALTRALSRVRLSILEGAARHEALNLVCQSAIDTLEAGAAMVLTPSGHGDELRVEAGINLLPGVADTSFSSAAGLAGEAYATGRTLVAEPDDPRFAPPARALIDKYQTGSVVVVPLHGTNGVAGLLVLIRTRRARPLADQELHAIQRFGAEAEVGLELAAHRAAAQRLELLEYRHRLGRDLHDNVIGRLFATGMSLQGTASRTGDPDLVQRLTTAVGEIDDAIKDIRAAVYGLRST